MRSICILNSVVSSRNWRRYWNAGTIRYGVKVRGFRVVRGRIYLYFVLFVRKFVKTSSS